MLQELLSFELLGLSGNAWFTIAVVLALFAAMIFSKLRTDIIFLAAMSILFVSGVVDVKGAFAVSVRPPSLSLLFFTSLSQVSTTPAF